MNKYLGSYGNISLPETVFVNEVAGRPVVNGDPAKRCCKANIFTARGEFVSPTAAASVAAAVFALCEEPTVKPAPKLQLQLYGKIYYCQLYLVFFWLNFKCWVPIF